MGETIQSSFNEELVRWCVNSPQEASAESLSFSLFDELDSYRNAMSALNLSDKF